MQVYEKMNEPREHKTVSDNNLMGASILPLMTDPIQGKLYFLLAKERFHASWPQGSNLWTDFGGKRDNQESAEQIAAREFLEESLGLVQYKETDELPMTEPNAIVEALKKDDYLFKVTSTFNETCFVTFVVYVPWDPLIPQRFSKALQDPEAKTWEQCYLEKSHLGLFSLPQAIQALRSKGYLMPHERCSISLLNTLTIVLPELQFYYPNLFL